MIALHIKYSKGNCTHCYWTFYWDVYYILHNIENRKTIISQGNYYQFSTLKIMMLWLKSNIYIYIKMVINQFVANLKMEYLRC